MSHMKVQLLVLKTRPQSQFREDTSSREGNQERMVSELGKYHLVAPLV
jgi:hypothetical protein